MDNDFEPRTPDGTKRINEIISFMKGVSVYVNPEEEIIKHSLNLENVTEEQIMYLITNRAIANAPISDIYNAVGTINTRDLMMLNLSADNLEYFIIVVGGFFYARAIKKMISKNDILIVKDLLGGDIYKQIIQFALESPKNEYPLRPPFKEQFHGTGHRIFEVYFSDLPKIIQEISMMRTGYQAPKKNMNYLNIPKDYALELVNIVQNHTLRIS